MFILRENVDNLKAAIQALMAARETYNRDDPRDSTLKWLIQDITHLLAMELVGIEFAETLRSVLDRGLVEAGAKLSKASKAQINQAIAALTELVSTAENIDESDVTAVKETIALLVQQNTLTEAAKSERKTDESQQDCASRKIPIIKRDRPNLNDKQVQGMAFGMCEANIPDADITSTLLDEWSKRPEIAALAETATPPTAVHEPGIILPAMSQIRESVQILGESASSNDGTRFDVVVIQAGMSGNRVMYNPSVLQQSVPLLEGRPMYIDHPEPGASRSIRDKVGWYENVTFDSEFSEGKDSSGAQVKGAIRANLNLYKNSGSPWFREMVLEAISRGRPQDVGISILAGGKTKMKRDREGVYKEVEEINVYASADAVAEPGAGGRPLALVASVRKDQDVEILQKAKSLREILDAAPNLSMSQIREARPDLFSETGTPLWNKISEPDGSGGFREVKAADKPDDDDDEDEKKKAAAAKAAAKANPFAKKVAEGQPEIQPDPLKENQPDPITGASAAAVTALQETVKQLNIRETKNTTDKILRESRLPTQLWDKVREKVGDQILAESDIRTIIGDFEDILAKATPASIESPNSPMSGYPRGLLVVPYGSIREGHDPVDLVQAALDDWFGEEVDPSLRGKFQPIRSMREFYVQVTGDINFDGRYHPENSVIREALPTAAALIGSPAQAGGVTFSGLFGTSMNRRMQRMYRAQSRWWEPVVTKTRLENMKQQDRVITHTFGALTERTEDGVEYTELTWGETVENYTPTEYGNVVTFGRRAMINDDLNALRRLPQNMARSAVLTINEFVSNLFTQNSGNGPTLADGVQVFNSASHQGNRVTTPLSRANAIALRQVIMKMTDQSSKRLDLIARTILGPVDLEDTMWELLQTPQVPESANNALNILNDPRRGIRNMIVVPNWTDANNWYLMADPADADGGIDTIEVGFLFGNEVPELLSQADPTSGLVWTNDVLSHKVRWDFGADWTEYRGAAAAIVA